MNGRRPGCTQLIREKPTMDAVRELVQPPTVVAPELSEEEAMALVWWLMACTLDTTEDSAGEAPSPADSSSEVSAVDTSSGPALDTAGTTTNEVAPPQATPQRRRAPAATEPWCRPHWRPPTRATPATEASTGWGHDASDTVRLSVGVANGASGTTPATEGATFTGPAGLAEGEALVMLATGTCLLTPGCTDFIGTECQQELDRVWIGNAGTAELVHAAGGLEGSLVDLRLEEVDQQLNVLPGGSVVEVSLLELGHRAYWQE